ncbi:MAG: DUF2817 domain-containing protein [Brevundimonas sp.]|uniref:M14 family metallopeptidase n=1 Tax=Brevundimonas sp. TaxID=1871086 RepID=UPI001214C1C2|nr:M14 family metallopeptidase [Brevundimonas sp.]RZJ19131.1 MAG: DUF2817 domain-containing protein [Brevundimonas sp.]
MGLILDLARQFLRDYNIDGLPASGVYEPEKSAGRALFEAIDNQPGFGVAAGDSIWQTPTMPGANGGPGDIIAVNGQTPEGYIAQLWEPLRQAHPGYITRALLGKDQSGTHDMWRYEFTPPNPQKTILLTCNAHGFERLSQIGVFLFLREVAQNWKSHAGLAHLRWNVRIVVVPIVNPWGLAQSPPTRWNSRLVDLNRNYDYRWTEYVVTNPSETGSKGSAPFSEVEAQYLRDMLDQYPEAVAWFDMHDVNGPGPSGAETITHILYAPNPLNSGAAINIGREVFESIKGPDDNLLCFGAAPQPSAGNYATARGLIGATPEATTDGSSSSRWTSLATTRAVKFWGNLIIRASYQDRPSARVCAPFVMQARWAAGSDPSILTSATTYADIPGLNLMCRVPGAGLMIFDGVATVRVTGAGTGNPGRVFLTPKIGIEQNPVAVASAVRNDYWEVYDDVQSGRVSVIPFKAVIPVAGNNGPISGGPQLRAGLWWRTSTETPGATIELLRYQATLEFRPSDHVAKFQYYRSTGFMSESEGAMKQIFPYPNPFAETP